MRKSFPPGDFQVGVLGAGLSDQVLGIELPLQLGVRIGAAPGFEIDASAGLIATSTVLPVTASVTARWGLLSPHGGVGTSAAVQVKIAGQVSTSQDSVGPLMTDTFANFSGVSVELPLQLTLGAVSGLLSFGATGSLWYPYLFQSDGVSPQFGPVVWLYVRAGILLDLGSVSAGISASTRTQQLPGGIAFLSSPIPYEVGAEVHWLIPGTRLMLSGILRGRVPGREQLLLHGRRRAGIPLLTHLLPAQACITSTTTSPRISTPRTMIAAV